MTEKIEIWLPEAKNTDSCGESLTASLYTLPLTLFLKGELGMGKTTFLQGFAQGLGIKERLTSPTYALEQRYKIKENPLCHPEPVEGRAKRSSDIATTLELLHIDLYRIDPKEAKELVDSTVDFEGIRCIEWSEKISESEKQGPHIDVTFEEHKNHTRFLHLSFHDISLPSRKDIEEWRTMVEIPEMTVKHCDTVGTFAEKVAHELLKKGIIVRPLALRRAGELHDLFRFLDFKNPPPKKNPIWEQYLKRFPGLRHEEACTSFLRQSGFYALATIIAPHGLPSLPHERRTIEQKVLYYADKRVIDRVVSIDERFEYFKNRYENEKISPKHTQWYQEVCAIEKELFPEGAPLL